MRFFYWRKVGNGFDGSMRLLLLYILNFLEHASQKDSSPAPVRRRYRVIEDKALLWCCYLPGDSFTPLRSERSLTMVVLKEITLKNFKSFKGQSKAINMLPLTAIVGRNGTGKSNFMDAISFAMGVGTNSLRVSRIEELVYRSRFGIYQPDMSVRIVLQSADGIETCFERSFTAPSCQYRINDNAASHNDYVEVLKRLGINAKIKNFLVFQGAVESIITKKPMERTAIFEEISGSALLATEYKCIQTEVIQLKQDLQYLQQNKRAILTEIRTMLYCKEKAHEYEALEKKYEAAQLRLMLFNLYHIDRDIRRWKKLVEETSAKMLVLETQKNVATVKLSAFTRACKKNTLEATLIESNVRTTEMELLETMSDLAKVEAKVQHAQGRVVTCRTSLESAKRDDEARKQNIKQLENSIVAAKQKKDQYFQRFSKTLGRDLQLRELQEDEYKRLKDLCLERFYEDYQQLMILELENGSIEDELKSVKRMRCETQGLIDRKTALHLEFSKRATHLEEFVKETERELAAKRQDLRELGESVESSKAKERLLSKELEDVAQRIGDFKINDQLNEKNKIVNNLRQMYPDVWDRLRNMCNPIHDRYNVAITKVLGRHLDSIVCDTTETAERCIKYLREQNIGIETFLPLDNIKVEPLDQHLRNISEPPNVKLLYDVINFLPEMEPVIRFVTRNTLVCETPKHAARIAFAPEKKNRHDCVSVDGHFCRTSGLISGGTRDLMEKVQRWDSSLKMTLMSRKKELFRALRTIRIELSKETSELSIVLPTVNDLEKRLNYVRNDFQAVTRETAAIEFEIEDLEDGFDTIMRKSEDIESRLNRSMNEIDQLKLKMKAAESELFAEFCNNIGVDDIRHYEEGQKMYKETMQKYDCKIDRVNEQLDLERTRNTERNVSRWEENLREAEQELESYLKQESDKRKTLNVERERIHNCEIRYKRIKKNIERETDQLSVIRRKVGAISKEYLTLSGQVNGLRTLIGKKKAHRHVILTEAKMHGLKIPTVNNPPEDSSEVNDTLDSSSSINESPDVFEHETNAKYDFSKLPSDLTKLESSNEIRTEREKLEKKLAEIAAAMDAIGNPNMKASQQLQQLKEKLAETKRIFERTSKEAHKASVEFEQVKRERYTRFMKFFDHAAEQVDIIYKKLTRSAVAQAYLLPENPEEPYLGGIHYHCIVPEKRFQTTHNLSGGEKTLAALPLLFAAHSGDSAPFKVLDEIDAALDNKSIIKVIDYIARNKDSQQAIVISHKKAVYGCADALIGIDTVTTEEGTESRIITFDMSCYKL